MQNIVLLMDPTSDAFIESLRAGNMYLNRFCIDEDAAFESTGVYYSLKNYRYGKGTDLIYALTAGEKKGRKESILANQIKR